MTATPVKIGMKPPHPGTFVREEILEPLDLSVTQAAEILGVRRATLSDLVNAKAAVSPEMALRIEKAFGVSMDTLLRMQTAYDIAQARGRARLIRVKPFRRSMDSRRKSASKRQLSALSP